MKKVTHNFSKYFIFSILILNASVQTLAFSSDSTKSIKTMLDNQKRYESEYDFIEGMRETMLGNYAKSIFWFDKALKTIGNSDEIYFQLADSYFKAGNNDKALVNINEAIKINANNKYYYLLQIEIFEKKQDFKNAIETYKKLIKKTPNGKIYKNDLAGLYIYLEKDKEALKMLDEIEKDFGFSEEIAKQKQSIFLRKNNLEEAIKIGKKLSENYPEDNDHLLSLAELLMANKKYEEAKDIANTILKKNPNNAYSFLILSDYYKQKNDINTSNQYLRKAFSNRELSIDVKISILVNFLRSPTSVELNKTLLELGDTLTIVHPLEAKSFAMNGDILTIGKKSEKALINYKKAVLLDNSRYQVWQQIVFLEQELNLNDSLIIDANRALDIFPTNAVLWLYKGLAYQSKKDFNNAIKSFEEGLNLSTKDKAMQNQFHILLADNYYNIKNYTKSDATFEIILSNDPNNYLALNNYSYYLSVRKEKLDYALTMSEKVVKNNPTNATYIDTYAWILYEQKNYTQSKIEFEKIIQTTNNGTIIEHYGDVLFKMGDVENAVQYWIKAKKTGDTSDKIDQKIADKKLYE